jgi:type IV pilus assembly protein PilM
MDLGRSAVKGVLIAPAKDGVEILDADIVPLTGNPPKGRETSGDRRVWEALEEFDRRHAIHKRRVAVAIPAQNTLVREIQVALVGKRNLEELVEYEAANAIPFVLDEVFWDYHLFEEAKDESTREGILFAVKKTAIHSYLQALSQIGADRVVEITIAPLADLSFLQFEMGHSGSAMLLDVGAENTSMVATDGSRFWMRNLNLGGNQITWLLRDSFDIPFEQAEEAKQNIARSRLAGELVEAIKPGLHELVAKIKTNIEYLERQGKGVGFDRIYTVGGSSRLAGLKGQIRQSLGQDLEDIRSLEHIFVSSDERVQLIRSNLDRLAVAIGTGIKALDKARVEASFVPESTARLARTSGAKRFLLVLGVFAWLLILPLYYSGQSYRTELQTALNESARVNRLHSSHMQQLNEAKQRELVERELDWLKSLGNGRAQTPALLNEVVRIFEKANEKTGAQFGLTSFTTRRIPTPEVEEKSGEVLIEIRGQITVPPEASAKEAYERLKQRLISGLRNSPLLARATGKAQFTDGDRAVSAEDSTWETFVESGDQIVAHKDGIWYNVDKVESDKELLLSQPFAGGDLNSEYTVTRVEVVEWSHRTLRFYVRGEVPAENVTPADTARSENGND